MAAIDDNDLRPEEKIGGFNSETPGDDTFFSENQDAYPGTMPDYSEYEEESPVSESEKAVPSAAQAVITNKKRSLLKTLVVSAIIILILALAADIYRNSREEKTETSVDKSSQNIFETEEIVEVDQGVYSEPVHETEVIDDVEPIIIEDQFLIEVPKSDDVIIDQQNTTRVHKLTKTASKRSAPAKANAKTDIKAAPPAEAKTGRLYTVQVYSSPSKDDAEVWLARLIKKNVDKAFITTKKIRNTMMYRVRFGAFSTQAEAKKAAIKQGFDQTWIDRVR
ncbi:MAG: SPOR domain-containing protein [Candidatus Kapabacteria bacterium]|jgi:septal ring-binding cell division protein DamX|nr:SPOR domain-containing protein [Candidatus Kapabacteria bacterium]